jgi:hypothetical protein
MELSSLLAVYMLHIAALLRSVYTSRSRIEILLVTHVGLTPEIKSETESRTYFV